MEHKEKDIGPICNFYSNKNNINSNNELNYNNENKISDLENSIRSSLINHNNNHILNICYDKSFIIYCKLVSIFFCVGLIVIGVYYIINN